MKVRKINKILNKIRIAILKTLLLLNGMSLMVLISAADSFQTWKPFAVMIFNIGFLALVGYANGLMDLNGEEYGNS